MTEELNIRSTYFPTERLPINRWFRFLVDKDLDLDAVDTNTLLGSAFVDGYRKNPDQACREMRESYADNAEIVIKVLGIENTQKLF